MLFAWSKKMKINYLLCIITSASAFISCSDKPTPYYVVDKIRTPTAQVYSQTPTPPSSTQGCVAGSTVFYNADTSTWCQQYPVRPAGTLNAATSVKLRFLVLAPAGSTVTLTPTSLNIFDLGLFLGSPGNGARGINPSTPTTEIPLSDFSFSLDSTLSTTAQTTPMQIQTVVFNFTPPNLNALIAYAQVHNFFPGFVLSYSSSSPTQNYIDNGYFTFYLLPDPADTASWTTLTSGVSSFVSGAVLAQAKALSTLNIPIQISSVSPANSNAVAAQSDNNISAALTYNPSPFSFSPVQWYVSAGTINNDRAMSTSWNPNQGGGVSSVFVARDLLGGMDFSLNNYTAQ